VKVRESLKKFDLWLRPPYVHEEHGEGNRPVDNVDALTTVTHTLGTGAGEAPATAPPNWVPSQQDDRPRH
jgi:hypothetical protein